MTTTINIDALNGISSETQSAVSSTGVKTFADDYNLITYTDQYFLNNINNCIPIQANKADSIFTNVFGSDLVLTPNYVDAYGAAGYAMYSHYSTFLSSTLLGIAIYPKTLQIDRYVTSTWPDLTQTNDIIILSEISITRGTASYTNTNGFIFYTQPFTVSTLYDGSSKIYSRNVTLTEFQLSIVSITLNNGKYTYTPVTDVLFPSYNLNINFETTSLLLNN